MNFKLMNLIKKKSKVIRCNLKQIKDQRKAKKIQMSESNCAERTRVCCIPPLPGKLRFSQCSCPDKQTDRHTDTSKRVRTTANRTHTRPCVGVHQE